MRCKMLYLKTVVMIGLENTSTPRPEKSLGYFGHNFIKYWPIYEILSLLQSAGNLQ